MDVELFRISELGILLNFLKITGQVQPGRSYCLFIPSHSSYSHSSIDFLCFQFHYDNKKFNAMMYINVYVCVYVYLFGVWANYILCQSIKMEVD